MQRIRILLLFGGQSAEHEVSIASAHNVFAALDDRKYDISLCYITKDGHWRLVEDIENLESNHTLLPVLGGKHFIVQPAGHSIVPDVIWPVLHGPNGEDGTVQGLAKLMHIPVVGCNVLSSALCMDKEMSRRLLKAEGLQTTEYAVHLAHEPTPNFSHITLQLGNPVFVKPANMGSSVGVFKVHNEAEFARALEQAHAFDTKVLIEQAITGREIECAVMGNHEPLASGVGEVDPEDDFYSYDAKYSPTSEAKVIIPADVTEEVAESVRKIALTAYKTLGCSGLARVDVFVTSDGQVVVNELNTLPGFTNISMYPKLWRATGMSYAELVDKLITFALKP
ncbi:MAG TPA: D-alanine--D-alanine ligase family protein [Candidatus Saccharimonadales bacterium]|nr:D-alanine--D-alanine ligase family protein [Candidatus Saccharimonadales bacterium]